MAEWIKDYCVILGCIDSLGINEFKNGYEPRTNLVKDKRGDLLQILTKFWIGGRITSLSC